MGEMPCEAEMINENVVKCFDWNSLHVAASHGETEQYFQNLLKRNPEFAEALDSQQRSLLHLASANGHVEMVKALLKARPDMCLARDRNGANPLHVAAMRGKVEVFRELFDANPHAARARVDGGERDTILHLCVKYNQLEFLKLLLDEGVGEELVNAKDNAGNTILHLAVADRRLEIIRHVLNLKNPKIDVNATNASKQTAMDILVLGQKERKNASTISIKRTIEDLLRHSDAKIQKDIIDVGWLAEKRNGLIIVAVLMATIAFQAGVTPPGGVWQDNLDGHTGGEAVMSYNYPNLYKYFLYSNTIGFVASLSTILLLITDLPFQKRRYVWMLVATMCLTITSMAFTYACSIAVITPKWERLALGRTIEVAVVVWCSVIAILLLVHTIHLIATIFHERRSRHLAAARLGFLDHACYKSHRSTERNCYCC